MSSSLAATAFVLGSDTASADSIDNAVTAWQGALAIHERLEVPLTASLSGELLEAFAWSAPDLIKQIRCLHDEGLLELLGAPYGTPPDHAAEVLVGLHLAEGLRVMQRHLDIDPSASAAMTTAYLPATTMWRAHSLARVLTNATLPNGGYRWALVDSPRQAHHDRAPSPTVATDLAHDLVARRVRDSSLCVTPIGRLLKEWFPITGKDDLRWWREVAFAATRVEPDRPILTWLGDPTRAMGSPDAALAYERSLARLADEAPVQMVGLTTWLADHTPLATADGGADPRWASDAAEAPAAPANPHSLDRSELVATRTLTIVDGEKSSLASLARRRALASEPSAVDAAPIIAIAARWLSTTHELAWCERDDVDGDGHDEIVLGNSRVHVTISPARGARLMTVALATSDGGALAVGPPGALVLVDGEEDRWEVRSLSEPGPTATVELEDVEPHSLHKGTRLTIRLAENEDQVVATYRFRRRETVVLSALSPDLALLLDDGRGSLRVHVDEQSCVATGGRVRARVAIVDPSTRRASASVWRDAPFVAPPHTELVAIKARGAELTLHLSATEIRPAS